MKLQLIEGEVAVGTGGNSKTQVFMLKIPENISSSDDVVGRARELISGSGSEELSKIFEVALARRNGRLFGDL